MFFSKMDLAQPYLIVTFPSVHSEVYFEKCDANSTFQNSLNINSLKTESLQVTLGTKRAGSSILFYKMRALLDQRISSHLQPLALSQEMYISLYLPYDQVRNVNTWTWHIFD